MRLFLRLNPTFTIMGVDTLAQLEYDGCCSFFRIA
jgi:hypothetical protein